MYELMVNREDQTTVLLNRGDCSALCVICL